MSRPSPQRQASPQRQSALLGAAQRQRSPVGGDRVRTVSQVAAAARLLVEERFRLVWIGGEVSNFRAYPSGHWYFSLKDDRAQLRCVVFASRNRFVRFRPKDGLSVVLRGRLSIYEARGDFQVIVDHVEPAGEGALRAAFEELKAALAAQGLFAAERKRPLPAYPRHLAVVSSRDSAALGDVLTVVRRRFPCVRVTCFYVAVQGFEAEGQILGALDRAERMRHAPDVVIVARGGGSLEDLAAFNLESVARRIAAMTIPVVSAVGHETDVTIADLVADQRAATPSAAAELATPDGAELLARLQRIRGAMTTRMLAHLRVQERLLTTTSHRLAHPGRTLEQRMLRTDELGQRLHVAMQAALRRAEETLAQQRRLLAQAGPARRLEPARQRIDSAKKRLRQAVHASGANAQAKLSESARALNAVSPLATLERGYAIVAKPDGSRWGRPVVSATGATVGESIVAHFSDGSLRAKVEP